MPKSIADNLEDLMSSAKALAGEGDTAGAARIYRAMITLEPRHIGALNNLGTLVEAEGDFQAALEYYRRAEAIDAEDARIHYNIAHALHNNGDYSNAIEVWRKAIELDPEVPASHYGLGISFIEKAQYLEASMALMQAIDLEPDSYQATSAMGGALFELGQIEGAENAYRRAITLNPSASDYFHLAVCQELRNDIPAALESYSHSINLNPQSSIAHDRHIRLLLRTEDQASAELALTRWLDAIPDDANAIHMANLVKGNTPERASESYIKDHFNTFAGDYEVTLTRLGYKGPEIIADKLTTLNLEQPTILDLGCGTGLSGAAIQPFATTLYGVDLSPDMLKLAKEKEVYDEVYEADIEEFLRSHPGSFDVIAAADTLIYFGDLETVFRLCFEGLEPGGVFLFTVEISDKDEQYHLQINGRFAHNEDYILQCLGRCGFVDIDHQRHHIRDESSTPVLSALFTANRIS